LPVHPVVLLRRPAVAADRGAPERPAERRPPDRGASPLLVAGGDRHGVRRPRRTVRVSLSLNGLSPDRRSAVAQCSPAADRPPPRGRPAQPRGAAPAPSGPLSRDPGSPYLVRPGRVSGGALRPPS